MSQLNGDSEKSGVSKPSATKTWLRKGNSELSSIGVYVWSIPALIAKTEAFGNVKTCPNAGICALLCYARNGRYLFGTVIKAHTRNLEGYLQDPEGWKQSVLLELQSKRFRPTGIPHNFEWSVRKDFQWWTDSGGRAVRIHDAGDFFSEDYLLDWIYIAKNTPDVLFYSYTKQVSALKKVQACIDMPRNWVAIYSLGGKEDSLIDKEKDRHDDIFPDHQALIVAGYFDQEESDLMAPLAPTNKIGIVANKIPSLRKKQGTLSFAQLQESRTKRSS